MQGFDKTKIMDKPSILDKIKEFIGKYKGALYFLAAFVLTDASLLGYIRPFALCYAMAQDENDRLWAAGGAFLGNLMIYGNDGMPYAAACIIALTLEVFIFSKKKAREFFVPPALALTIIIVKLPFAAMKGPGYLGLLLLEGIMAAICTYTLMLPSDSEAKRISTAVTAIIFMLAFARVKVLGLLSPATSAAIVLIMAVTFTEESFKGAALGLVMGAVLDMAHGGGPLFIGALGLSSVIAGIMPVNGRIPFAVTYLVSGVFCLLWGQGDPRSVGGIYDFFVAVSIFLILPDRFFGFAFEAVNGDRVGQKSVIENAGYGLKQFGKALSALSKSVEEQIEAAEAYEEDISVIFDKSASGVCKKCKNAQLCWIEGYVSTFGWLNDLIPTLKAKGFIEEADLPKGLGDTCIKKDLLSRRINHEYMAHLRRKSQNRMNQGGSRLLKEQYDGLNAAIEGLIEVARADYVPKPLAEKQAQSILRAYRRDVGVEVFSRNGRLNMCIGPFEDVEPWVDEEPFLRSASLALKARFLPHEVMPTKNGDNFLYKESETLAVSVSCAVQKKPGEEMCGDSSIYFKTDDGRAIIIISDGMGAGAEASKLSKNAIDLVTPFIKSGCSAWASAMAALPLLRARYGVSGFATLDILEIDLFTGAAVFIKWGGADSFIIDGGIVTRVSQPSLPPGAEPEGQPMPKPREFFVRQGTRIVMASDGADIEDEGFLCQKELSSGMMVKHYARESLDDYTAIVISISNWDKSENKGQ